jgi:ketosteroid isomerase-like protein
MPRATTPEEIEALLEDAFILRDATAAAELFEESALLVDGAVTEARGRPAIDQAIARVWDEGVYVADSSRVFQAGDLALSLGQGVSVLRRRTDGEWRLAIAMLRNGDT